MKKIGGGCQGNGGDTGISSLMTLDFEPPTPLDDQADDALLNALAAGERQARERAVWSVDREWARMAARIDAEQPYSAPLVPGFGHRAAVAGGGRGRSTISLRSRSHGVWYVLAGLVIGAVGLVTSWSALRYRAALHAPAPVLTYATANGQRANITLPDGSTVALNVASRLDVPADYVSGNRTLHLTGEALFTVRHHDGAPFTVVTGSATARVLGTRFAVRHYATDSTATVAVRDGKVMVRSVVLTALRQAEVSETGALRVERADPARFGFSTGTLTLNGVPLAQAVADLNRWYNVDLRLADPSLATRRITLECGTGSLADLAVILEMTLNVRVTRAGRVLTIYPRR